MTKTVKQVAMLVFIIFVFVLFNGCMYFLLTGRLSNNFSDTSQSKMIDVKKFLPHVSTSDLVRVNASLKMTDNLPVLDGATALLPVYAAIVDNVYPEGCVTFEDGVFDDNNYYGENFADDSAMQYNNTVRGYKAIVDGTTDILFCAAPSETQKQYAVEQGVELVYIPVGLEGFVFFVNENNPVDSLTVDQIRDIYGGMYTNWKEIGGADRVINPVTRLAGSGSQSAMDSFMKGREIAPKSIFSVTGASIGFSFRYYMDGLVGNDHVKMLALNGVYPSAENIRNGTYPIIAPFYAIYRTDNENTNIPVLINWLLSEEGQTLIEESGYVRIQ